MLQAYFNWDTHDDDDDDGMLWYAIVESNVPLDIGNFVDAFKGQMTQPTVSETEGRWLANQVKGQSHQAQLIKS